MNSVVSFFKESHSTNPKAFWWEMFSALSVIIGSAILTYTVLEPRPDIFIPFYWIGSLTGVFGAYYRLSSWTLILCSWFTIMNTIALWRLFV